MGTLIGIALNLYIALGRMDILMMLILLIHEHGTCFHLFVPASISFFMLYSFLSTGLLPPWLGLFLGILFFLLLCQMRIFPQISVSDVSLSVYNLSLIHI